MFYNDLPIWRQPAPELKTAVDAAELTGLIHSNQYVGEPLVISAQQIGTRAQARQTLIATLAGQTFEGLDKALVETTVIDSIHGLVLQTSLSPYPECDQDTAFLLDINGKIIYEPERPIDLIIHLVTKATGAHLTSRAHEMLSLISELAQEDPDETLIHMDPVIIADPLGL